MQANCILIASNFVTHPQVLILSVLNNGMSFPILIANEIFNVTVLLVYFCDQFVTADVTAMFVNNQHGIQRRGQDINKKFVFEGVHSKEVDRQIS